MGKINFNDVDLYDSVAKAWAMKVQKVTRTQMRRLFDEIKQYKRILEFGQKKWEDIFPLVKMQKSKITYTIARAIKNGKTEDAYYYTNLKDFIISSIEEVKTQEDYNKFCLFFEAMYGFHYEIAPKKEGE